MTRALRVALRATGQVGILATTVNMTVLTAVLFISHIVYGHGGGERDDAWQPFFYVAMAALIVPTYVVSLVGMASTGGGPLDREIVAPTIMVAILAAVGGCHLLSRRRIQLKRTRA